MSTIIALIVFIYTHTEIKINFYIGIATVILGVLIPLLFDVNDNIIGSLKSLNERMNPDNYRTTINLLNERVMNFSAHFYFFLASILNQEQKELLLHSGSVENIQGICEGLQVVSKLPCLYFERITYKGKITFSDQSANEYRLSMGELADICRIFSSMPPEMNLISKSFPLLINAQSVIHQVEGHLVNNAESQACEALTKCLLHDVIKFLKSLDSRIIDGIKEEICKR